MPKPDLMDRIKRNPMFVLILCIGLVGLLLGMGTWFVLSGTNKTGDNTGGTPQGVGGISSHRTTTPTPNATATATTSGPVSPLVFGTNLGLFTTGDQVLTSATTRTMLQQMHARIIRMPVRSMIGCANCLSEATIVQAAQTIKDMGAIPLLVLHGERDTNVLADDTNVINDMNRIFGNETVYYEYGNEDDLNGYPVNQYLASWNAIVPQLKSLAPHGQFIGPVNFQYDRDYLTTFLLGAQPRPDEVSWHEYTCDDAAAPDMCISHIAHWTTHIQDARSAMMATIGMALPIMITEWNYAPNAPYNDGKNNDPTFMTTWTTTALQTLAANRIFASMQYSCVGTTIPLLTYDNTLTAQGLAFQSTYEQIIVKGQQPGAATPVPGTQPTATPVLPTGPSAFSFEGGGVDGWTTGGQGITSLHNSTSLAKDGTHSLQATLTNGSSGDYPYVSVKLADQAPQGGQTVVAYVYIASNAVKVNAKIFVADGNMTWHSSNMIGLTPGTWTRLTYSIPADINGTVRQVGIQFNAPNATGISTDIFIDAISWG